MKSLKLADDANYSFSDYFKLNPYVDDLLAYFDYQFARQTYPLPHSDTHIMGLDKLLSLWHNSLAHISLNSEMAKREFLIAPLLLELVQVTQAKLKVEFPLEVNNKLKGTLDYLLQSKQNLLVIKAKNGDLEQGFVQLAVELVALDQWLETDTPTLYGAVSVGNVWQFGVLVRHQRLVIQDTQLFRVPVDVEDLLKVMIGVLQDSETTA